MDEVNAYSLVAAAGLGTPAVGLALLFCVQWLRAPYIQRDEARQSFGLESDPRRTIDQLSSITYGQNSMPALTLLLKYADMLADADGCDARYFASEVGDQDARSFVGRLQFHSVVRQEKATFKNTDGERVTRRYFHLTVFGGRVVMALRDAEAERDHT